VAPLAPACTNTVAAYMCMDGNSGVSQGYSNNPLFVDSMAVHVALVNYMHKTTLW
jgi:hypothetical protein